MISAIGSALTSLAASILVFRLTGSALSVGLMLMAISSIGSTTIGFAASGLIASRFPIEWAFYLDALSFILSAV